MAITDQALTATTVTSSATRQLQANTGLVVSIVTATATFVKSAQKGLTATVVTVTASVGKNVAKSLAAALATSTANAVKSVTKGLTATVVIASATTVKRIQSVLAAVASTATVVLGRYSVFGLPFLYTAANWNRAPGFYLEVYLRATGGTVRARLYNTTDGTAVVNSEVTTVSATYVRLRSAALTLTDGKLYTLQLGSNNADGGGCRGAKLVIV